MPGKKSNKVKNKEQNEALKKGGSKQKGVSNTNSKRPDADTRPYEERTRGQLYEVAKELEIEGRSKMDKDQLIRAIRKVE